MRDRRGWWVLAVLAGLSVLGQLYGLYRVTGPPTPPWFPHADKLEHTLGFALPTTLVIATLDARAWAEHLVAPPGRRLVAVAAAFGAHAVVSEVVQHTYLHRTDG